MYELEQRAITGHPAIETRADGKEYIVFTPIVFNQRSQLLGGWFFEQIDARAFDDCDLSNVIGPFNHNEDFILGRTQAGTLEIEITPTDVRAAIPIDSTDPDHVRVVAKIRRGDVRGASFAFVIAPGGADWDTDPVYGTEIRTVKKIAILADVSPVVNPAYLQTSIGLGKRSMDDIRAERDQYAEEKRTAEAITEEIPPSDTPEEITNSNTDEAMQSVAAEHDRMAMELEQ